MREAGKSWRDVSEHVAKDLHVFWDPVIESFDEKSEMMTAEMTNAYRC